jgi:uncharacterized protein
MWGPGIAALLCFAFFRKTHTRTITFWRNSKIRSICFYLAPMALLAFAHPPAGRFLFGAVRNPAATHLTPASFMFVVLSFCWALGEELGWRGFLQDAVRPMRFFPRFTFIGFLWAFWHFTNYTTNRSLHVVIITLAIFFSWSILWAFLIGMAVERSHSLCVAVTIHALLDLALRLRTEGTWIVLGIAAIFWAFLLRSWPQTAQSLESEHVTETPSA